MNCLLEGIGISLIGNLRGIVVSHSVRKPILQLCGSFLLDSLLEMCIAFSSRQRNESEWMCDEHVTNREPRRADNCLGPYRNVQDSERSDKSPSGYNPRKNESTKKEREILTGQPEETPAKTRSIPPNPMANNTEITTQNAQITKDKDWCSIRTELLAPYIQQLPNIENLLSHLQGFGNTDGIVEGTDDEERAKQLLKDDFQCQPKTLNGTMIFRKLK